MKHKRGLAAHDRDKRAIFLTRHIVPQPFDASRLKALQT